MNVTSPVSTDLYIDGRVVECPERLEIRDPARPGDVVGSAAAATRDQALSAVAAAKRAFPSWAARSAQERGLVLATLGGLAEHHEADAEILTRENGKIRMESKIDLWVFNHRFELACALADQVDTVTTLEGPPHRTDVTYQPLGVVTIIIPFNWPLAIMEIASGTLTRVALELGGNDPALILDDALLDDAAIGRLFSGVFDSTGQICMAAKRIYVHRSRYDEVVAGLAALLERTALGHGLDEGTTMGPLHSRQQRDFVAELVEEARASGAEVREYGAVPEGLDDGNFLRPSLVLDPDPAQRVVTEEQFGPTVPILPFDDVEDAIAAANDTWAGLCSSVWTEDPKRAADVGARLSSGYTWVNNHGAAFLDERAPFGGWRRSGMGREMGVDGLREFMDTHSVSFPVPT